MVRLKTARAVALLLTTLALIAAVSGGARAASTLELPFIVSLTGPGAPYGLNDLDAVKLAASEINAKGGVDGYLLQIKEYDSQSQPTQAVELIHQLNGTALVTLGPLLSSEAAAGFPVANSLNMPAISPGISDGSIPAKSRPWSFDLFIPAQLVAPWGTDRWIDATHVKHVVRISDGQDLSSRVQSQLVIDELKKKGVDVVREIAVTTGQPTFASEVTTTKSLNPDGIVVSALPNDAAAIVKTIRGSGITVPILITMNVFTPDFMQVAGSSATNLYAFTEFWWGATGGHAQQYVQNYMKVSNGMQPGVSSAHAYEMVYYVADALRRSGVLKANAAAPLQKRRELLRDALAGIKNFQGVTGTYSMGPQGYIEGPGLFVKIDGTAIHEV